MFHNHFVFFATEKHGLRNSCLKRNWSQNKVNKARMIEHFILSTSIVHRCRRDKHAFDNEVFKIVFFFAKGKLNVVCNKNFPTSTYNFAFW